MKVTFLSSDTPLTKSFELVDGKLRKISHPRIINVTSYEENVETIEELHACILSHAAKGHCFLKGNVSRVLTNESRAGSTNSHEATQLLLLDLDKIKTIVSVAEFLGFLQLMAVDYIVQYSSSMGVDPNTGLSAHIFILLTEPWHPAMLKQWLIHKNLSIPQLRNNLSLASTNNTLKWGLDVTTCQNDKLIYIAPPILGAGVQDTFAGSRIQLVKGSQRSAELQGAIPSAETNRLEMERALNELREKNGLHKRKAATYKSAGTVEYFSKPDRATVTGIRTERGFVYLNINNGDSWAYYHPEHNPEFIYNFKSEPIYKTAELLPEYWAEVKDIRNVPKVNEQGKLYLAFRDYRTAGYWNGSYDTSTETLDLKPARSKDQLFDFLKGNNQPIGDYVPDWNILFEPNNPKRIDTETCTVNTFQPTEFMMLPHKDVLEVPPLIKRIIHNAVGSDDEFFEHFMNWLAVILQYRTMTETGTVLHGTTGTGKGILINRILKPIFGYVQRKRMREFDSNFNDFIEKCLILWVDEAEFPDYKEQSKVMEADIRNYITEPEISIRRMYTPSFMAKSYINMMFAGNADVIVTIRPNDRRFNVAPFQTKSLEITQDEVEIELPKHLVDFYHYLMTREADRAKARAPLNNAAKKKMIEIGRVGIDRVSDALLAGDYGFFLEQIPHLPAPGIHSSRDMEEAAYATLVGEIGQGKKAVLVREEVRILFQHCLGDMPDTTYKFATKLKHHGITFVSLWRDGRTVKGVKVKWNLETSTKPPSSAASESPSPTGDA